MSSNVAGQRPNFIGGLLGWAWLVIVILPIYFIVVTSIRRQADFYVDNPLSIPSSPTFDAYALVLQNDFLRYFGNSVIVTVCTVAIILAVAVMASYVIVRSQSRFARRTFDLYLIGIAIPLQATIIPVYYLIVQMRLYDTLLALILPSAAFAIPITVLILVNFMRDIPQSLFESMRNGWGRRLDDSLALGYPVDTAGNGDRGYLQRSDRVERILVPTRVDAER